MIFVFGSNLAGRHGAGAAKYAMEHEGAEYGEGMGLSGNSYAIPTKDQSLRTLPLNYIQACVDMFVTYARQHPDMEFKVTRIGCGLAGYKDADIAPMFERAPDNCLFDSAWQDYLDCRYARRYWGTL